VQAAVEHRRSDPPEPNIVQRGTAPLVGVHNKADGSQALDLQRDALIAAGVEPGAIYEDMASGAKDGRPGLAACLKALRQDDVLVIWKLDRLGRNLKHLIETVEDLTKRGLGFKVLLGAPVDTATSQGKLMFTM
jgi:DNA invertase Pin-like site-specific DNA recombinase